jgi:hypothetical protein
MAVRAGREGDGGDSMAGKGVVEVDASETATLWEEEEE